MKLVLLFIFVFGVSAFHWLLMRQPQSILYATRKGREDVATSTDVEISDLLPRNPYESQIFSSLTKWRGQRIESYKITKDFPKSVIKSYSKVASDTFKRIKQDAFFRAMTKQQFNHSVGDSFECDLYFKPAEPNVASIEVLLSQATEQLVCKSGRPLTNLEDKWIFTEISEDSRLTSHKLLQLERSLRFLPVVYPNITVGAAVILISGPENEGKRAMDSLTVPDYYELFRQQIPVYIGWVPTRNTYKQLSILQTDMKDIKSTVDRLQTDMKDIKSTVDRQEKTVDRLEKTVDRLENLMIKILDGQKP